MPAAPDSAAAPYRVEVVGFVHQVDRGYGSWRGTEVRLQKVGPRFTPTVFVSAQTRPEGTQLSLGASSYVILNDWSYLILGASTAPDGSAELYPSLRWDVTGLVNVPRVPGLVVSAGVTDARFDGSAGATTVSLGTIYYVRRAIFQGVVRFNEDRLSGADSRFTTLAVQVGREGAAWSGGSFGWGNEAYSVLGLTPGAARFRSVVGTIFHRRWIRRHQGLMLRMELEQKLDTYDRIGLSALIFFEF